MKFYEEQKDKIARLNAINSTILATYADCERLAAETTGQGIMEHTRAIIAHNAALFDYQALLKEMEAETVQHALFETSKAA